MYGKSITLFHLLGFAVRIDLSWLILAMLVSWSLASGLFPRTHEGLSPAVYWGMGVAGAVGLFASILFHEFSHSLVARRFGLPMKGITLFIFGGVAEMDDEPPSARAEFLMAAAGPASSVVLGGIFIAAASAFAFSPEETPVAGVLGYLGLINLLLAGFNLIPAFPLDGGRVLRAGLWHWKKDLAGATRTASRLGMAFGLIVVFIGVLNILIGNFIGGLWQSMIGMFLRSAAQASYQQMLYRSSLAGSTVAHFMNPDPVWAPASITVRDLVDNYIYRYHFKMFPVRQGERLLGCVTTRAVGMIPREEWDRKTVGEVMDNCAEDNSVSPGISANTAFTQMSRTGKSRLMVVENDRLVGVISIKDIMEYLAARLGRENGRGAG